MSSSLEYPIFLLAERPLFYELQIGGCLVESDEVVAKRLPHPFAEEYNQGIVVVKPCFMSLVERGRGAGHILLGVWGYPPASNPPHSPFSKGG